jgi:hypothetical protein
MLVTIRNNLSFLEGILREKSQYIIQRTRRLIELKSLNKRECRVMLEAIIYCERQVSKKGDLSNG